MATRRSRARPRQIEDIATLKALADPVRLRLMLLLLEAPRTVKELAKELKVPTTRLYYHMGLLEERGLARVESTRMVSGIEESRYVAVSTDWAPSPALASKLLESSGLLDALLKLVSAEVHVAVDERPRRALGAVDSALPVFSLVRLSLSAGEVALLQDRVQQMLRDFDDLKAADEPRQEYHLFIVGYPTRAPA